MVFKTKEAQCGASFFFCRSALSGYLIEEAE